MGFSPDYRAKVEAILAEVVPIRTKAMFGGVGIYSDDLFFALIAEDKLYFKVDETNRADYEAADMSPFFPFDSPTPMGYWEVPCNVQDTQSELKIWVDKALGVAARKAKKRK